MSDHESGSIGFKGPAKLWDAEPSSFATYKAAIMRRATAQDCMSIALPTSDILHTRHPEWLGGEEKSEANFMYYARTSTVTSSPAAPAARMHLTFGDVSPVYGTPSGEGLGLGPGLGLGSPAPTTATPSGAQTTVAQGATNDLEDDPNDLDVDNPILVNGKAVTFERASVLVKVWLAKTKYKSERKKFEDDTEKCDKRVKNFLAIILAYSGDIAMEAISTPYQARDAPAVWAKLLFLGEANQEMTLHSLHTKRNHITLKATGNITKMQAEMERLHRLIHAANDAIPSDPSSVSIIHADLQRYEAFDVAIAIRRSANCNILDTWWTEMKKVETDSAVAVLGTLKRGSSRAHNM
jgi:hypothetical protein